MGHFCPIPKSEGKIVEAVLVENEGKMLAPFLNGGEKLASVFEGLIAFPEKLDDDILFHFNGGKVFPPVQNDGDGVTVAFPMHQTVVQLDPRLCRIRRGFQPFEAKAADVDLLPVFGQGGKGIGKGQRQRRRFDL